jgi:RNA polymerase sigma factor (sigma-70 family)
MDDSQQMLADYVKDGSESAFRGLVARYINSVHSTAVRLVNGDTHLAEDITQTVFVDLARKAHTLPPEVMVGGWLHRDVCFVAGKTMRGERRRRFRERQAVAMNIQVDPTAANLALVAPILDEAINQLEPDDRTAILLRFFDQLDFRAVGQRMASNEDAARMRVNRALDKLQVLLKNRGVTFPAAALGTALGVGFVSAAPVGLAATTAGTALASLAADGVSVFLLKFMTKGNLKFAIVGAVAVAALTVPLVIQHHSLAKLRVENQALQKQATQRASLWEENQRLSNPVVQATIRLASAEEQVHELARLRDEVGRLRQQSNDLARALAATRQINSGLRVTAYGKRIFPNTTMAAFAKFIGGVLQAPVADQTGLTGTYYIAMTPPNAGGSNGKLERVSGILLNELGLQLMPLAGPFTNGEEPFPRQEASLQSVGAAFTNVVSSSSAADAGYALKIDHSDAPGLQAGLGKFDPKAHGAATIEGLPQGTAEKLMLIDTAKRQWALDQRKQNTDTPTWQDLQNYLVVRAYRDMSDFTNAPEGDYIIGTLGHYPRFHPSPAAVQP